MQSYRMPGYKNSNQSPSTEQDGPCLQCGHQIDPPKQKLAHVNLADVCWQSAQQEIEVAKALVCGFPAQSVLHAHIAAEQVLKYALLKTCGISQDEYRGEGAHDLVALYSQISANNRPDISQQKLKRLANSFDSTRYVAFPPSGGPVLPSASYAIPDADEAYNTAG
jgi:HEPN domain-containing protein